MVNVQEIFQNDLKAGERIIWEQLATKTHSRVFRPILYTFVIFGILSIIYLSINFSTDLAFRTTRDILVDLFFLAILLSYFKKITNRYRKYYALTNKKFRIYSAKDNRITAIDLNAIQKIDLVLMENGRETIILDNYKIYSVENAKEVYEQILKAQKDLMSTISEK